MSDLDIKALTEERDHLRQRVDELTAANRRMALESATLSSALRRKQEELSVLELRMQRERLTGLYTRDYFEDRVDQLLAPAQNRRSLDASRVNVLVILDIDRFKHLNDTYGHPAGDKILATLGTIIKKSIREKDFAARFGGDEFVIFFQRIRDMETAERKVIAIRNAFEHALSFEGDAEQAAVSHLFSTFSYGIAVESDELNSFATLYQDADQALYAQKRERRKAKR